MTLIRFSKTISLYEELTPFYNPTNAEEFFLKVDFSLDRLQIVTQLYYGIEPINFGSDNWIEDENLYIFNNLPEQLKWDLIDLIEEFYLEDNNSYEL